MDGVFDIVYKFLKWLSALTGLTYQEVNIITYFIITPGIFIALVGNILKSKIPIITFVSLTLMLLVFIPNFESFSAALFEKSVVFLNWFEHFGLNYVQASVVICVIVPVLILSVLIYLKRNQKL